MKKIDAAYLSKKINQLNKKIHRAKKQGNENKVWWRKMKFDKLISKLKGSEGLNKKPKPQAYLIFIFNQIAMKKLSWASKVIIICSIIVSMCLVYIYK